MNLVWTYLGNLTRTLPASLSPESLPLDVQLVGRKMQNQALLVAGAVIEKVLDFTAKAKPFEA